MRGVTLKVAHKRHGETAHRYYFPQYRDRNSPNVAAVVCAVRTHRETAASYVGLYSVPIGDLVQVGRP